MTKNPFGGKDGSSGSSLGKNPFNRGQETGASKSTMPAPPKNPFEQYRYSNSAKAESSSSGVVGHRSSSDTYDKRVALVQQKIAEEKAAKEKAAREERERLNKTQTDQANQQAQKIAEQQKAAAQQQQENIYRAQARDLKNQIAYWQQQLGRDPETDFKANGNIAELTGKLGGIPPQYSN